MLSSTRERGSAFVQTWWRLLRVHNVRRLAGMRFLNNMYFYSAVIVLFETSRGLDFTGIFLLEAVLLLASWLLDIPTGVWADRIGYRRLLITSCALNAASVVVTLLAHGFWQFAIGSALFGAGIACASGAEDALLLRSLAQAESREPSGSAFALLGACGSAGFVIGLATGTLFAANDPTLAVAATLAPATLAILVAWTLRPVAQAASADDTGERLAARAVAPLLAAWRLIRSRPALIGLGLVESASWVCANAIFWYNQPFLGRAGVATRWFGPLTAIAVAGAVVTPLLLPVARRWLSRRVCFALALIAPGLAYLALATAGGAAAVVALIALIVAASAWAPPLLREAINQGVTDKARATTLSALSFIGALAGMAANALVGRAGDAGLGVVGYGLGAALIGLGLFAPWLMAREPTR
ncbi:MAG: MFS transporter [Chloroflexota bacterium]|nr:MFS transporter [Chloroflexota bacterium]